VRRTARLVYARHCLATGDRHRAEDLTQETYLMAWRSIRQLKTGGDFRAWLMAIARSAEIDAVRREHRKKRNGPRGDAGQLIRVSDDQPDPSQVLERDEARRRAIDALRELPEEYRQPLALRYLAGADYDEIARQLALSNGSLRGLLHRGMVLLRKKLKDQD
jgi:RNA polymerase sigma-70 factor, ECF subfamily